jgi:hypothetical protein
VMVVVMIVHVLRGNRRHAASFSGPRRPWPGGDLSYRNSGFR